MVNGKQKGKRGELELSARLKELGLTARRTQQFCGKAGDSDVECEELSLYHIEVKRVEKLNIDQAMSQAVSDCGSKTPVVIHRRNGKPWLATLFLEDFVEIAKP